MKKQERQAWRAAAQLWSDQGILSRYVPDRPDGNRFSTGLLIGLFVGFVCGALAFIWVSEQIAGGAL